MDKAVRDKKRLKLPERCSWLQLGTTREESGSRAAAAEEVAAAAAGMAAGMGAESPAQTPLHGVVLRYRGASGVVHTSDNIKGSVKFGNEEYGYDVGELRGVVTRAGAAAADAVSADEGSSPHTSAECPLWYLR